MTRVNLTAADMVEDVETTMTVAVADTEVDVTTIADTVASAATVTMTVAMLPVESTDTAAMIDTDVEVMSVEAVATTIEATSEVAIAMVAVVKPLPLLALTVTLLLVERAVSHMPEVEATTMTDLAVNFDR
jgi:hypothetical protein